MAKVSLRIYNREIESLIDQGHLDEAIAHCRHILKTFPKHLETYRLLGKAYLEAKRYEEAVDIFNRVLMAVPDDFVSSVGMSIIRDEENKLDDAIWHMERAFEAQPSNAAIQGELQRLYGRRDGLEPPKIRMTRGALAHMYVQGELYPQAISEIRAVLATDPQRADMQVLLARAFFRGGQKADASDMCAQLLKRYPYCFDANRIMVELLPASERAESTQVYRHRVNELDPYTTFTKESVFRSEEVSDASINLERLEYSGQDVEMGKDWGAALGIGLSTSAPASSDQPEWLKTGLSDQGAESQAASLSGLEPASASKSDADIPDFLRDAGWRESSGAGEEASAFDSSSPEEALTPASIPDWLKGQMPAEPAAGVGERPTVPPAEVPDWLSGLGSESSEPAAPSAEIPDWLGGLGGEQPAESSTPSSSEAPDWLKGLDTTQPEQPAEQEASSIKEESVPDWLSASPTPEEKQPEPPAPEPAKPAPPPASIESLGASSKEQDDAIAWLEMLAAKHGAKPEELVTDPAARSEKPPEWVEQARALAETQPPAESPAEDETGIWLRELAEKEPQSTIAQEEQSASDTEIPEWLKGLESQPAEEVQPAQPVSEEQPSAEETSETEWVSPRNLPRTRPLDESALTQQADVPDWLIGMEDETEQTESQKDVAEWLSGLDRESKLEEEPAAAEPANIPEWLSGLEKEEAAPEVEPVSKDAEVPDWLSGLEASAVSGVEEETEETEPSFSLPAETESPAPAQEAPADLPEWLRGLDQAESEEQPEETQESIPSWLKTDLEEEEEPRPAPVTPADWHPAEPREEKPAAPQPEPEIEMRQPAPRTVSPLAEPHPTPPPPDVRKPAPRPVSEPKPAKPARIRQAETAQSTVAVLSQAQNELNRGDIPTSLAHYNKIIRKGKHLEETIRDLRESLYRYPVEVGIWQTLGDAYMRANRLQEALDAYNKAEELLR